MWNKSFKFDDISKLFPNIVKVIYSDTKIETIIVSTPFFKFSINVAQAYYISSFSLKNSHTRKI